MIVVFMREVIELAVMVEMEGGQVWREEEQCEGYKGQESGNGRSSRWEQYDITGFEVVAIELKHSPVTMRDNSDFLLLVLEHHRLVQSWN